MLLRLESLAELLEEAALLIAELIRHNHAGDDDLVAAALLLPVRLPRRTTAPTAGVLHDLREGWTLFRSTTWLWVVVLGFGVLNAIHAGAWYTLGPAVAKETIGIRGWGYVVSAESVGLLLATAVLLRVSFRFPLRAGMLGCLVFSAPLLMLGLDPHLLPLTLAIAAAGFRWRSD